MAAGAGAGLAAVPATAALAAARPAVGVHHVAPFGAGAHRAAGHVRHTAARSVTSNIPTTRWVSNTTPLGPTPGSSCANPGYATITDAINASASGDIIKVCSGTYDEQLVIQQVGVVLQAKGPVTVVAPATPASPTGCDGDGGSQLNQDVVDICGAFNVTITGFTFKGSWDPSVCNDSLYGVAVLGGAHLTMSNSTVEDIGGNPQTDGCQGGVGIEVGLATSASTSDPGTATLNNDVVNNYQKNGITVDGALSSATINSATVIGTGETPAIAQNGIQVSDGATAKINSSSVSGNECDVSVCGPNGFTQVQSCGILLFDAGKVTVNGTAASANDIGVDNIEDYAWSFYTPPSPFTATSEGLTGLRLSNRYENAFLDEGKTTLNNSTLSGGEVGIETDQGSYQTTPAVSVANGNTISGASEDAILVASDNQAGDPTPKLTSTLSSFDTTNAGGVANQTTSVLNVTSDWWGDASGPSDWSFGSGSSVSADANFFPWSTNAASTTFEACAKKGLSETASADAQVICATAGTGNAFLSSGGFNALLIGNKGNDQLNGASTGEAWIIGGLGGSNVINGNNGSGFIQERGNTNDTVINASGYTVAAS
jgi:hypothetical protein